MFVFTETRRSWVVWSARQPAVSSCITSAPWRLAPSSSPLSNCHASSSCTSTPSKCWWEWQQNRTEINTWHIELFHKSEVCLPKLYHSSLKFKLDSSPPSATSVNWVCIGSGNGLSPIWHQAIIWTSTGLLSIGPSGTNFSEILTKIQKFSFTKMHLTILWKGGHFVQGEMS